MRYAPIALLIACGQSLSSDHHPAPHTLSCDRGDVPYEGVCVSREDYGRILEVEKCAASGVATHTQEVELIVQKSKVTELQRTAAEAEQKLDYILAVLEARDKGLPVPTNLPDTVAETGGGVPTDTHQ